MLHAVGQAETHSYSDFQVTLRNGRFAIFSTGRSLDGYPSGGHRLLYRYDGADGELNCVSCPGTGIDATADTTPPPFGLGLTDDGRVFFTTAEQLVLRDTNNKKDAYEWRDGTQQLISDGLSPLDSSLLGVSADGTDAYFFTTEVLTSEDENGNAVKLYDARAGGGFDFVPSRVPCQASDECHGPGTAQPLPPQISTVAGGGSGRGNVAKPKRCRKGSVRRHGRCEPRRKHHRRKHHRKHAGSRNG